MNNTSPTQTTHVCHLVYSFGFGGLEQVIANLVNNTTDPTITHSIVSLTDDMALYYKVKDKAIIHCLHKKPGNDLQSHMGLFKLLNSLKVDTLNTYNFGTLEYQFTALLAGVKNRIHSAHGYGGDSSGGTSKKRNVFTKFISLLLNKYVTVSPDLESWARDTVNIAPEKVTLIHNGINTSAFSPTTKSAKDSYTICTVGRADPVKNQTLLIHAYASALESCPEMKNSRLVIAGDGPSYSELESLVHTLGLEKHIDLLGYQDNIPAIMQNSDIFVLSSHYEAMPMTILEAMACKLPVIATNVGGTPYLLSDKEGWLIESNNVSALADALMFAYRNPQDSLKKATNGLHLVTENYTIEKMCDKYCELYKQR